MTEPSQELHRPNMEAQKHTTQGEGEGHQEGRSLRTRCGSQSSVGGVLDATLEEQRAFTPTRRLVHSSERTSALVSVTAEPRQGEPHTTTRDRPTLAAMQVDDASNNQPTVQEAHQLALLPGEQLEDVQLRECRAIIDKMTAATTKQRNVSMDIMNGLRTLNDLVDAIQCNRRATAGPQGGGGRAPQSTGQEPEEDRGRKRAREEATSPLSVASPVGKKPKEQEVEWQVVASRKKNRPRKKAEPAAATAAVVPAATGENTTKKKKKSRPKARTTAVIVKPAKDASYEDVLASIRKTVRPEEMGAEIRSIRRTRQGEVLLKLSNATKAEGKASFSEAVRGAVGLMGSVKRLEPKETIKLRDLDCLTTAEEVQEALVRELGEAAGTAKVIVPKANNRGQKLAIVELEQKAATKLMKTDRLRIGMVMCRHRWRTVVTRCFRCLAFEHLASNCKGPDRRECCYKCGEKADMAVDCRVTPKCVACADSGVGADQLGHVLGSGKCRFFRDALADAKKRTAQRV